MSEYGRQPGRGGFDPECLVDGTHVRLVHRAGPGTPALVVFGDEVSGPSGDVAGMFGLWEDRAADIYEIAPKGRNWYPAAETGPLVDVLAQRKAGKPAVALGVSMGAYGALRHGARAGCAAVLAFAPQARITPGMAGVGARHAHHYRADLHAEMEIEERHLPERAYAVIDPADAHDLLHAELLRLEAGLEVITLPHMGHRTDRALTSAEVTERAVAAAQAGDTAGLARALRRGRQRVPDFLARLSLACSARGHHAWAADIAERSKRRGDTLTPDLQLALAVARAGLGHPLEALEEIEALVAAAPRNPTYWKALADQYERMGEMAAAAEVLELALVETESFQFCWRLIHNRMAVGADEEARLLAEMAMEHWPARAEQVGRLKGRIGRAA